jgi:thioredoxin reductase (NADPH)
LQGPNLSDDGRFILTLANNERVRARAVVIASGARYRRFDVENLAAFEGATVHYWASPLEGRLCAGQEVALVGGGNSAGQAAVYLSGDARPNRTDTDPGSSGSCPRRSVQLSRA